MKNGYKLLVSGLLMLFCSIAQATPTLVYSDTTLIGINMLDVGAQPYNVTFVDNTYPNIWGVGGAFDFNNQTDASAAAIALRDIFNTDSIVHTAIFGVTNVTIGFVNIPFQISGSSALLAVISQSASNPWALSGSTGSINEVTSLAANNLAVFAKFELASVPEPSVLSLLGLTALGAMWRSAKRTRC